MTNLITLSGLGILEDQEIEDLQGAAKDHDLEIVPGYYDYALKGESKDVEAFTVHIWGMTRDEWEDNALIEEEVTK